MRILVVDDEDIQRDMLSGYLKKKEYEIISLPSATEAISYVDQHTVDIVITDQKMPEMSGLELAEHIKIDHPNVSVIILTAFGSIDDAVTAMKNGVEDYLTKPINLEELDLIINRIIEQHHLKRENRELREKILNVPFIPGIVYVSEAMEAVMSKAVRASASTATVLISGESGTGKEVVARAIHELSDRKSGPFVPVNCSAIPENLIESELFGHEKGSFTGADQRRIGRFEQADNGTLFLDEIGELPASAQVKLLRVLQERTFERVGGNQSITVSVRIIAATNRSLEDEAAKGTFRQDLFYRLNVIGVEMPPLRKRKDDIPVLVEHFLKKYAAEHGKHVVSITTDALDTLIKYSFPGNIRELSNIIEQAVVLTRNDSITLKDIPIHAENRDETENYASNLEEQVAELERKSLIRAMRQAGGNKSAAARLLGISERKIRYMLQKYSDVSE